MINQSYFLGTSSEIASKLRDCYSEINQDPKTDINVEFHSLGKGQWKENLPHNNRIMVLYEVTEKEADKEKKVLKNLRQHNPRIQWVLLADPSIDYFEIAACYGIGNILRKDLFDASIIRALTIRLLTGNIFGFYPYFPNGFSRGPLHEVIDKKFALQDLMTYLETKLLSHADVNSIYRLRAYLYELLTNTISYSVYQLAPEMRDKGDYSLPSYVDIPQGKPFKISMAEDGEKYGFSVMDASGSLSLERILSKLRRQFKIGDEEFPPGIWDLTGRGLSLILKDNRMIINIIKDYITEIIFLHYKKVEFNKYESIIITEISN